MRITNWILTVLVLAGPAFADGCTLPPGNQSTDDMMTTVSGYVIGGGDTTPEGLMDSPRKFVYQIRTEDDTVVNVTYTAYPPSPAGIRLGEKIELDFQAGSIQTGDFLEARGRYDEESKTLIVSEEGDYIKTLPSKP